MKQKYFELFRAIKQLNPNSFTIKTIDRCRIVYFESEYLVSYINYDQKKDCFSFDGSTEVFDKIKDLLPGVFLTQKNESKYIYLKGEKLKDIIKRSMPTATTEDIEALEEIRKTGVCFIPVKNEKEKSFEIAIGQHLHVPKDACITLTKKSDHIKKNDEKKELIRFLLDNGVQLDRNKHYSNDELLRMLEEENTNGK